MKSVEKTDHLGNVRVVVSDRLDPAGDEEVMTAKSFMPYGMVMPGRRYSAGGEYPHGFNGMRLDNEWSGTGNHYTTKFRQYDPRVGRWMSLDPKMKKYPEESPYAAFHNNPVHFTDPQGDAPPEDKEIEVEKGDNLSELAKEHETTIKEIKDANPQIDWDSKKRSGDRKDWVYEGETLNIPGKGKSNPNAEEDISILNPVPDYIPKEGNSNKNNDETGYERPRPWYQMPDGYVTWGYGLGGSVDYPDAEQGDWIVSSGPPVVPGGRNPIWISMKFEGFLEGVGFYDWAYGEEDKKQQKDKAQKSELNNGDNKENNSKIFKKTHVIHDDSSYDYMRPADDSSILKLYPDTINHTD